MSLYEERRNLALKLEALDLLGGKCFKCGLTNYRMLQIDHIKPLRRRSHGLSHNSNGASFYVALLDGKEDVSNLQVLCANHHAQKTYDEGIA